MSRRLNWHVQVQANADSLTVTNWWRFSSGPQRQQYIIKSLVVSFVWQAGIYHFSLRGNLGGREHKSLLCKVDKKYVVSCSHFITFYKSDIMFMCYIQTKIELQQHITQFWRLKYCINHPVKPVLVSWECVTHHLWENECSRAQRSGWSW